LVRFEFESGIVLFYFSFTFVSFEESCLLVSWCAGGRCGMACNDEDRGRSRRPGAEDQGWLHRLGTRWPGGREVGWRRVRSVAQVGYSVAGRSRGRVAPCAVCTWHMETRSAGFLVEPQNQGRQFVSGLASKPLGRFSLVWPQNQW
jgi:hypothetical protein